MTDQIEIETLRVFRFVREYIRVNGIAPSQREIAEATFMATTTMVIHLTRLEMCGWLYRDYNIPRSIREGEQAPSDANLDAIWQDLLDAGDDSSS